MELIEVRERYLNTTIIEKDSNFLNYLYYILHLDTTKSIENGKAVNKIIKSIAQRLINPK